MESFDISIDRILDYTTRTIHMQVLRMIVCMYVTVQLQYTVISVVVPNVL